MRLDAAPAVDAQDGFTPIFARRARFHFAGEIGFPTEFFVSGLKVPLGGGGFGVEFGTPGHLRPTLDLGFLYGLRERYSTTIRSEDLGFFSTLIGVKLFPGRYQNGPYVSTSWGVCHISSVLNSYQTPCITFGAGATLVDRVDLSVRFQAFPTAADPSEPGPGLTTGLLVVRLGFFLGGTPRGSSGTGSQAPPRANTVKGRLVMESRRADSLELHARTLEVENIRLTRQRDDQMKQVDQQEAELLALRSKLDSAHSTPRSGQAPNGFRYVPLAEQPGRFNAAAVYTVLHTFTSAAELDTFRVISSTAPNGTARHELWITTVTGKKYKEQLYPAPLAGVQPSVSRSDEELEQLRVRMTLAPGAFIPAPVSMPDWQFSDQREARDLVYRDLTMEQFGMVFRDQPILGFRFQSDEQTTKVLVYSKTLDRIVNIKPE